MKARALITIHAATAAVALAAGPAWAHAFPYRYDLPIPLWLYLLGAGAAVALSFVVMARFFKHPGGEGESRRLDLLKLPGLGWLGRPMALNAVRGLSVAVFVLLIVAGFFGDPQPFHNLAPTFVWVIWWVGMAFVSALLGDLWALLNPWKILFTCFERILGRHAGDPVPARAYPSCLGRWPAVVLFLVFAWLELISDLGDNPRVLASLIVAYSALTWAGMARYGRRAWLENAEAFTVVFGLLARFAPTKAGDGHLEVRPPAVGLLIERPLDFSGVCFVLLLLSSVTFDGILETPMWAGILQGIAESRALRGTLIALQGWGVDLIVLIKTIALIVLPSVFVAVYAVFCHAIAMFGGGGRVPTLDVIGYFVLSLVPIAIAYHLSHYLSYLLIAGQNIIPLASDPFGFGWDLFGTAAYRLDIGIVNAKMVWYVAVTAIVAGHVFAVYVAHVMAMRVFAERGAALRSQAPMVVLMVAYTMLSLWILSQPVVN
jgi:hypothetical protein